MVWEPQYLGPRFHLRPLAPPNPRFFRGKVLIKETLNSPKLTLGKQGSSSKFEGVCRLVERSSCGK